MYIISIDTFQKKYQLKYKLTGSAEVPAKVERQLNGQIPELSMLAHYQPDKNGTLQLQKQGSLGMSCFEYEAI